MRCPICGAKLYQKTICPFCKVTADEIKAASNKKVKEYRKTGRKDLIHFTNVLPQDVDKVKLWLYTIFLGLVGVNHFMVCRNIRAGYAVASTVSCLTVFFMKMFINFGSGFIAIAFQLIYEICFYCMVFNILFWFSDILSLILKGFKVPVVLPEKEKKNG